MAKGIKKVKPVVEEKSEEIIQPPVIETLKEEAPKEEEPETKEEPVKEEAPVFVAPIVKEVKADNDLPMEDNIIKFVEENPLNRFKLNDFLKSLYGVPKWGEPAKWFNQKESKLLAALLDKLQKQGYFGIEGNKHLLLGKSYYTVPDQRQMHHDLSTVEIFAKK